MKTICIDFDGTVVTHEFPEIGKEVPNAVRVLKALVEQGDRLILWTMRADEYLEAAVQWFAERDIPLFGVNRNPEQDEWTNSPKAYGQLYIDDAAFGCPLIYHAEHRPYVDWGVVGGRLIGKVIDAPPIVRN